jgi:glucose-6-phosphate 1-epimerase
MLSPTQALPVGCHRSDGLVNLRGAGASSCTIHLHGATVTSWCDRGGRERLYLSPTAALDGSAPIRGGIPVCWPQFGPGPRWPKQHGFARRLPWALDEPNPAVPRAVLRLADTPETLSSDQFPYRFELMLTVELGDAGDLSVALSVRNAGDAAFSFTVALHAYFSVPAVSDVRIAGLSGLTYRDNADGLVEKVDGADTVVFAGEVDRCYVGAPDEVVLPSVGVTLHKSALPELVLWNPYVDKTRDLPDMPDDGWKEFVCVEPAVVYPAVELAPGAVYEAGVRLVADKG